MSKQLDTITTLLRDILSELRAKPRADKPDWTTPDPHEPLWIRAVTNGTEDWPALESLRAAYPRLLINPVSNGELIVTMRLLGDVEDIDS